MAAHNELGQWGENLATEYLRSKGYVIIDRDWRSGHRDLDIIAEDGDVVVFVEVKTRRNNLFTESAANHQPLRESKPHPKGNTL